MNKLNDIIVAGAVALGAALAAGCGVQGSSAGANAGGASVQVATVIGSSGGVLLEPGRDHDISSADPDGTVQFRILAAPSGALEDRITAAVSYNGDDGKTVSGRSEVTLVKGTGLLIATVRSSAPLDPAKWYTLQVATGAGVDVSDPDRIGADQQWRMRLYTGSDPQLVSVKSTGTHIQVSFSEPVNVRDVGLALASAGKSIAGCFETASGCVDEVTDPNVLVEEVSFKLRGAPSPQSLEISARRANAIHSVQLTEASWKNTAAGGQSWRRPVL